MPFFFRSGMSALATFVRRCRTRGRLAARHDGVRSVLEGHPDDRDRDPCHLPHEDGKAVRACCSDAPHRDVGGEVIELRAGKSFELAAVLRMAACPSSCGRELSVRPLVEPWLPIVDAVRPIASITPDRRLVVEEARRGGSRRDEVARRHDERIPGCPSASSSGGLRGGRRPPADPSWGVCSWAA